MRVAKPSFIVVVVAALGSGACAPPVIVAGAAAGASIVHDKRTAGTVLEDQTIEIKAMNEIGADAALAEQVRVSVTSFNNVVLLTGQAPTRELRAAVLARVKRVEKIKQIHDEIQIAPPIPLAQHSTDSWITAKVKSALLGAKGLESTHVKVVTENDTVYLMGLVAHRDAQNAAEVARQVTGVKAVVKVFEYID